MPRRVVEEFPDDNSAADAIDVFATRKKPKKASRGVGPARFKKEIEDIARRVREKDWTDLKPTTLVAVYAWCFQQIFDFTPSDFKTSANIQAATRQAGWLIKNRFDGNPAATLAFIRWVFDQEVGKEAWARTNKRDRQPLHWKSLFYASWLMDQYRAAQMREKDRQR